MLLGQILQTDTFQEQVRASVGKIGLAGQVLGNHGGAGLVPVAGVLAGLLAAVGEGFPASGSLGKYRAPCWPQADRVATPMPRTSVLTKI